MHKGQYLIWDIGTGDLRVTLVDVLGNVLLVQQEEWSPKFDPHWPLTGIIDLPSLFGNLIRLSTKVIQTAHVHVDALAVTSQRHNLVLLNEDYQPIVGIPNTATSIPSSIRQLPIKIRQYFYDCSARWPTSLSPMVRLQELLNNTSIANQLGVVTSLSDWINYKLTGNMYYEMTQALETLLLDLSTRRWNPQSIDLLHINYRWLPPIIEPGVIVGPISEDIAAMLHISARTPVISVASDTCMAAYSVTDVIGDIIVVGGTTTPIVQIVDQPIRDTKGRTWTNYAVHPNRWLLESNCGPTGLTYQWVRRYLYSNDDYAVIEDDLQRVSHPKVFGLFGANLMDATNPFPQTWGGWIFPRPLALSGIGRADFVWSVLWDLACAAAGNTIQLTSISGKQPIRIWAVGGLFQNRLLGDLTATMLRQPLYLTPNGSQATSVGCGLLCNVALGMNTDRSNIIARQVNPKPELFAIADSMGVKWWEQWNQLLKKMTTVTNSEEESSL